MTDIFMSHSWKNDETNRDTHARVVQIVRAMERQRWSMWLDEDHMRSGNLDAAMAKGIEECRVFFVCLTCEYMRKVNEAASNLRVRDNCANEWNYAVTRRKIMLPLVMDRSLLDTHAWLGVIAMHLGPLLYIDACDGTPTRVAADMIRMLASLGVHPHARTRWHQLVLATSTRNRSDASVRVTRSMVDRPSILPLIRRHRYPRRVRPNRRVVYL